ncbi:glycosyltransferase family 39 protein [Oryzifoliimicrobium ureilyticus]|uniref:glycosyltransferase family 39 protein n=1 Tax=Oryzifoliimicrobium ureilyticus TaxID=3113724 RepID=UPI00307662A1
MSRMVDEPEKTPYSRILLCLLVIYFCANFIVRLLLPNTLELDEGQQIFFSQWIALGYGSQPPFYNWLQYFVIEVLGSSVFSLALLKNTLLLSAYLLYFGAAKTMLRRADLAAVATLGLLTIPQISFEAQRDLSHTVAVIFSACLFLFFLCRTIEKPSIAGYSLTGVAIGIGFISKYNFVMLPIAALFALAFDGQMRKRILDWRILLTLGFAVVIAFPHLIWLKGNIAQATAETVDKMSTGDSSVRLYQIAKGLFSFTAAIGGFGALTFILYLAAFRKRLLHSLTAEDRWTAFIERLLLLFAFFIVMIVVFGGASNIKDRWLTPVMLVLPAYLCLKMKASNAADHLTFRRFLPICIAVMVIIPTILGGRVFAAPWTGSYQKLNIPYQAFARHALAEKQPSFVLVSDMSLAGNMRLQLPQVPVMTPDVYPDLKPSAPSLPTPALIVWHDSRKGVPLMPENLREWLDAHRDQYRPDAPQDVSLPYNYGRPDDTYVFHYIWLEAVTNQ